MNDLTNEPAPNGDLANQIAALRLQNFILLLLLIIVSGTLTVFLFRQATLTRRDIAAVKPQALQVINTFKQDSPVIQNFVQQLIAYGKKHPDFEQQVLKRYGITEKSVAAAAKK